MAAFKSLKDKEKTLDENEEMKKDLEVRLPCIPQTRIEDIQAAEKDKKTQTSSHGYYRMYK